MSQTGLIDQLSLFSAALRNRGLTVTAEQTTDMARALSMVDLSQRSQTDAALRSLTVTDPDQIPLFDQEFEIFFGRLLPPEWIDRNQDEPGADEASYAIQGMAGSTVADVQGTGGRLGGGEDRHP